MSQITKIKRDGIGIYVIAGGWVSRPFFGTSFNEGDTVKTHHFGGSTMVGVGDIEEAKFKENTTFEYWSTTGIMGMELNNTPVFKKRKTTKDYFKKSHPLLYQEYNMNYSKERNKDFKEIEFNL